MKWKVKTSWLVAAAIVWGTANVFAMAYVWKYKSTAGQTLISPRVWPVESRIKRFADRAEIVMLVHPKCTCSLASMEELAQLMQSIGSLAVAHVLFLKPEGVDETWEKTELWEKANKIPNVTAIIDEGGKEAKIFNAKTSGFTLLYGVDNQLKFSGGITLARGHIGDNPGKERIIAFLKTGAADRNDSPTFGCSLEEEENP